MQSAFALGAPILFILGSSVSLACDSWLDDQNGLKHSLFRVTAILPEPCTEAAPEWQIQRFENGRCERHGGTAFAIQVTESSAYLVTAHHVIYDMVSAAPIHMQNAGAITIGLRSANNCPQLGHPPDAVIDISVHTVPIDDLADLALIQVPLTPETSDFIRDIRSIRLSLGEHYNARSDSDPAQIWGFPAAHRNGTPQILDGKLRHSGNSSNLRSRDLMFSPTEPINIARGMSGGPALVGFPDQNNVRVTGVVTTNLMDDGFITIGHSKFGETQYERRVFNESEKNIANQPTAGVSELNVSSPIIQNLPDPIITRKLLEQIDQTVDRCHLALRYECRESVRRLESFLTEQLNSPEAPLAFSRLARLAHEQDIGRKIVLVALSLDTKWLEKILHRKVHIPLAIAAGKIFSGCSAPNPHLAFERIQRLKSIIADRDIDMSSAISLAGYINGLHLSIDSGRESIDGVTGNIMLLAEKLAGSTPQNPASSHAYGFYEAVSTPDLQRSIFDRDPASGSDIKTTVRKPRELFK